ncbi:glycosyl transferase family 90-domain-containing protein [Catenaria anguillulae PL171]|uniref:Glycosyl transferase family 90-domain-containing protein n=1 Tax=Catenaria anguillulae PL171 TaxID=765915 RepID=A0A1Y2HE28_9FUNG|nr:glycosyl transferase family 90-domain-containing protein [Catenaria anguillulae PL171]
MVQHTHCPGCLALSVLALALATGLAISTISPPTAQSNHHSHFGPAQLHNTNLLFKRLPLPPPPITTSTTTPARSHAPTTRRSQQASTESQPHPLHRHPPPASAANSNKSTTTGPEPHPLDTCAHYDDLNLLTRESAAYYAARGGLSRRDFATAVRDCELRNYECVRFQIVHGEVYAVHPVPAAFQSRTLATLLLLQTLADRATARWKRQVTELGLLPAHYWTYSRPVGVHHGWVMPEYALAGWPEAGLTTWIEAHTVLTRLADVVPWASKNSTLVWRGTNLITLRAQLLRAAPYFEPKDWFDIKSSPAGAKDAYMTMAEQCGRFKYLLYTEGYAQSGRLKYQLSCGSLIISHPPVYREYWTPLLKNGVHWVVLKDTDWTRVPGVMREVRMADEEAQAKNTTNKPTELDVDRGERETRAVPPALLPPIDNDSTLQDSSLPDHAAHPPYTPQQMAHNAAQFARRVFSQDAMSCQAQAAMWAYRRSINWNQFTTRGGGNAKREEHTIRPHPNAVPIKQLAREVLGQWMEVSGGRIRRRRAYHKDQQPSARAKPLGHGGSGGKEGSGGTVEGQEHVHLDLSSPRSIGRDAPGERTGRT